MESSSSAALTRALPPVVDERGLGVRLRGAGYGCEELDDDEVVMQEVALQLAGVVVVEDDILLGGLAADAESAGATACGGRDAGSVRLTSLG